MTQQAAASGYRREVVAAVGSLIAETAGSDEEVATHLRFLCGAVQAGRPAAFAEYASWAGTVHEARGTAPDALRRALEQVERLLVADLPEHARLLAPYFAAAREASATPPRAVTHVDDPSTVAGMYLQALLTAQRRAALVVAREALAAGLPLLDLYADVIQAAQRELGRRWAAGTVSIADEHVATAISQFVLSSLYDDMAPEVTRGLVVVTGVQGELHQLGSQMVADALEDDGWSVRFLGTDLPDRDVLDVVSQLQPGFVAVSTTVLFNLPAAATLIGELRALDPAARILVGGSAFRSSGEAWREMGADAACFDVRAAVEFARRWDDEAADECVARPPAPAPRT